MAEQILKKGGVYKVNDNGTLEEVPEDNRPWWQKKRTRAYIAFTLGMILSVANPVSLVSIGAWTLTTTAAGQVITVVSGLYGDFALKDYAKRITGKK